MTSALSAAPAATVCAECHPDQVARHRDSPHAHALRPILETDLPRRLQERPIRERGGWEYVYHATEDGLEAEISKDGEPASVEALLEWTFGAGGHGQTAVGRDAGRYFEHRVSYYALPGKLAITLGHPLEPPRSPRRALGRRLPPEETLRCFHCHATGVRYGPGGADLRRMTPGIKCERCHGSGEKHIESARTDAAHAAAAIKGRRGDARATLEFCGECHRSPSAAVQPGDPLNVRFQPIGLAQSLCYQKSGRLTCTTCHDPHAGAEGSALRYNPVCRSCHAAMAALPAECPRPKGDCLSCHMPRRRPNPYLEFTDHRIGLP